jgi:hypothetical protein
MKYFCVCVLLLVFICGCDPIIHFNTNGEKKYSINCDCGILEISSIGGVSQTFAIIINPIAISGVLNVNADSLKIELIPEVLNQNTKIYTRYKGEYMNGKFPVEKNQPLSVGFEFPKNSYPASVIILPCNFILCNDKPLLTDTIKISIK